MNKALLFFCLLGLFFSPETFCQGENRIRSIKLNKITELNKKINYTKKDRKLINQLSELSRTHSVIQQFDEALKYGNESLKLAKEQNYLEGIAKAYATLGAIYFDQGLIEKSQETLLKAEKKLIQLNDEEELVFIYQYMGQNDIKLGDTLLAIQRYTKGLKLSEKNKIHHRLGFFNDFLGYVYYWKRDYQKSIYYFGVALEVYKRIDLYHRASLLARNIGLDLYHRIALSAGNIGLCYLEMGDRLKSIEYYILSATNYKKENNKHGEKWTNDMISRIYRSIGDYTMAFVYNHRNENLYDTIKQPYWKSIIGRIDGLIYLEKGDYNQAEELLLKSLKDFKSMGSKANISITKLSLTKLYFLTENFEKSMNYAKSTLEYAMGLNNKYLEMQANAYIGSNLIRLEQPKAGIELLKKALTFYKNSRILENRSFIYENLSLAEEKMGNFEPSLEYYKKHSQYFKLNNQDKVSTSHKAHQFELEKEKLVAVAELKTEKLQKQYLIIALVATVILIIILIYLFRLKNRFIKSEQEKIKLQQNEVDRITKLEEFKSRFLTNVTHEFKTPLTLIKGHLEVLNNTTELEKDKIRYEEMQKSSDKLLELINHLMKLAKIEDGQYQLYFQKEYLFQLITSTISSFQIWCEKKGIRLSYSNLTNSSFEENKFIYSQEAITTILNNILSNAIKFTPEKGEIEVKLENIGNDVLEIRISDTGIGIPKRDIDFVFDRFYQVETPERETHEGSGIGLAMVKELTLLHGGFVRMISEENKGTTVVVQLKSAKEHQVILQNNMIFDAKEMVSNINENNIENKASYNQEKPIILVVEDQQELRKFIVNNLGNQYQFIEAKNGNQGVQLAQEFLPDLIISDIMMPELDGYSFAKIIKETTLTSHIPILLLTAKSEFNDKIKGLDIGADDYLTKPFSLQEIQIRVRNILNLKNALRLLYSKSSKTSKEEAFTTLNKLDQEFVKKIEEIVENNFSDSHFDVGKLAEEMFLSTSQLTRKLKSLIGKTPSNIIKTIRMEKAKTLLMEGYTVADVSWKTGFEDPAYFSRVFKKEFNVSPSNLKSKIPIESLKRSKEGVTKL